MLIPARQLGYLHDGTPHDSQKRWWPHAMRASRAATRQTSQQSSLHWRWHQLLLVDRTSLVIIYVVKLRLAFHNLSFPRFHVSRFPFSHFQRPRVMDQRPYIKIVYIRSLSWTERIPISIPRVSIDVLMRDKTRGQSNLTKSASRGANSPVRGHPRGSKVVPLNSWGRVSY